MTEHTSSRLDRNAGQAEFLAVTKKIQALFEAGFDRKTVHGLLKDKGLITMCYATFCRQLSRHKDKLTTPKTLGSGLVAESPRTKLLKNLPATGRPTSLLKN